MSLRDRILASTKPAPVQLKDMPEWGAAYVRVLTVGEIINQERDSADDKNKPQLARAFCRLLCEEDGTRVFDPDNPADIQAVLELPWPMVRRVLEDGNKANKVDDVKPGNV